MNPERLPPHSPECEQVVLGCCIENPNCAIPAAIEQLGTDIEVFYDLRHQTIFKALAQMFDQRITLDLVSLQQRLKDGGTLDQIGGIAYLASLQDMACSKENIGYHASVVAEKHTLRRLIRAGTQIAARAFEHEGQVEETLDRAEAEILAVRTHRGRAEITPIKLLVREAIDEIERCHQSGGKLMGLSSGFSDLDKLTRGFRPGKFIILAGPTGGGKTSLAMNMAESVCLDQGKPVGVFSLEMGAGELALRMICSRARVNLDDLQSGQFVHQDFPKLLVSAGAIANSLLFVDDAADLSILELRARARRMRQRHGIEFLVIDYTQLMNARGEGKDPENRTKELDLIANGIKNLAKELNIPILALSQLNDEGLLRDSRAIGHNADIVARLEVKKDPKKKARDGDAPPEDGDYVPMILRIRKNRGGRTGPVPLLFARCFTRFESVARIDEEDVPQPARGRNQKPDEQRAIPTYDRD